MSDAQAFSPDYTAARARFRSSAMALGLEIRSYPVGGAGPDGEDLTVDVARLGPSRADRAVVVSSGLHGVEGYLGSAVQAALLEDRLGGFRPADGLAIVLIHALNPYGFAWTRRVNEDNVDLNRNFLLPGEAFGGAPDKYAELDPLLNPPSPPPPLELFLPRALWAIVRHGMPALKNAVAGGQYEFPKGLFYGGSGPTATHRLVATHLREWIGGARRVLHVDFHTGLGKPATYKLLVDHERDSAGFAWLAARFGAQVEGWEPGGVSYRIRGGLGAWCRGTFGDGYDVLAAEFGTVPILSVIAALRAENRAHHWGEPDADATKRAKDVLRDTFAPRDRAWRDRTVAEGLAIVDRAIEALSAPQ